MRRLVFLAALIACPASAETSLSRYGQVPSIDPTQLPGQPMYGPYLNWAGKRLPQTPSALPVAAETQPTPGPLANTYLRRRLEPEAQGPGPQPAPQPTQLASRYQAPAPSAYVPQAPRCYQPLPPQQVQPQRTPQYLPEAAARPLPDSLYSPPPQASAPVPPSARLAPRAPSYAPVAPPPPQPTTIAERLAAAPPPVSTGPGPRLYSVHRGYGLQPDAIPQPQSGTGYVLIGPADGGVQIPDLPQKPEPDPDKPF